MRPLTANERNVLAHMVPDPDAWWAHAYKAFGETKAEQALAAKVARWQAAYDAAVSADGQNYRTRAQRDAVVAAAAAETNELAASEERRKKARARSLLTEAKTTEALELLGII